MVDFSSVVITFPLTSQGGNQGILRSASYLFKRSRESVFEKLVTAYGSLFIGKNYSKVEESVFYNKNVEF